ncbi:hypothetical protein OIU77_006981 [Salix suchowensis]|uniref:PH domain-containing protein n=1 Tax=Salix suchowensis TaxID=1278906 RepID=A0ABQ9ANP9_9ROSI|nr:hypothetical protein OIU77_006981 [Salix suchowensis]
MKIWGSASEEGWLLPKGFDSLDCIQTLELKSSAEPGAEEAFFNQVSSIRESRSGDKRFSIFTGTKRLHLRAEIREDRLEWMEALQAVKDMFPRMSNSELMAPMDNVAVSNELRKRLQEEEFEREVLYSS